MNIMELLAKLDSIGYYILYFHLSLLWQSSIVMIVVLSLSYFLRRKRSFVRHLIWVLSLLVIPLIPLITWIIYYSGTPKIPIQVIPPYSSTQIKLSKLIEPPYKAEDSNADLTAADEDVESITNDQSITEHIPQNKFTFRSQLAQLY